MRLIVLFGSTTTMLRFQLNDFSKIYHIYALFHFRQKKTKIDFQIVRLLNYKFLIIQEF